MKYTTFACEMICITKRFVTFNKYARNFTFHKEMKTTLSHTHAGLCLSQLHAQIIWNTLGMHMYKMKTIKKNAEVYITHTHETAVPQQKWNLRHTTRQVSHDKLSPQINTGNTPNLNNSTIWSSRPVIGSGRS